MNPFLLDSKSSKALQKGLYILDSTTISLFSQILKGVGRTPKNSEKKGGIKAHTLLEAPCVLPSFVDYSAAAIHDHRRMSSILSLPSGSFATFDMGYIWLTIFSYIDIVALVVDPLRAWRDLKEAQRKQALAYNPKYIQLSLFDDL